MSIGGRLGAELEFETSDAVRMLFGETTGCLLIEVPASQKDELFALFDRLPIQKIGKVIQETDLKIRLSVPDPLRSSVENIRLSASHPLKSSVDQSVHIPVAELVTAWNHPLA